jgi:proteasome lid subunit RPN8/RPN11
MPSKFPTNPCFDRHPLPVLVPHAPTFGPQEGNTVFQAVFQGTIIRNEPAYRPRPVSITGYHRYSGGSYDAFVKVSALEAIADRARRAAPHEMIGYLVGRPFRDAKGAYVFVTDAIFAESARCGPVTVETTFDDERDFAATLLADHPLGEKVGWFHSHPFYMPSYSPTDLENQRFWSEPFQLGLLACLDQTGAVTIVAFRGPEAEEVNPPYMTSGRSHNHVPPFRPVPAIENREIAPKAATPTDRSINRRPSLALMTFAVAALFPIVNLIGVWLVIQEIRKGRDGAAGPSPAISNVAPPMKSDGQPIQAVSQPDGKHP